MTHPLARPTSRLITKFVVSLLVALAALHFLTREAHAQIDITSIQQLDSIGVDPSMPLDGSYELGQSLDASGFAFTPIGSNPFQGGSAFTGIFNGNGHTISGLTINDPSSDVVGLFGYVIGYGGHPGTIENLHLTNETVVGNSGVGGVVGYSDTGRISGVSVTGSVTGNNTVGGLVGNGGSYYGNSSLTTSFSSAIVTGASKVGGLVGGGAFDILNSYATGAVIGTSNVGGLAAISSGTVSSSYASGAVTGESSVGGLLGATGAAVTNSYWDTQTTGQSTSGGGGPLTTAQLTSGTLPTGFSSTVWKDAAGQYPTLIENPQSPPPLCLRRPITSSLTQYLNPLGLMRLPRQRVLLWM